MSYPPASERRDGPDEDESPLISGDSMNGNGDAGGHNKGEGEEAEEIDQIRLAHLLLDACFDLT